VPGEEPLRVISQSRKIDGPGATSTAAPGQSQDIPPRLSRVRELSRLGEGDRLPPSSLPFPREVAPLIERLANGREPTRPRAIRPREPRMASHPGDVDSSRADSPSSRPSSYPSPEPSRYSPSNGDARSLAALYNLFVTRLLTRDSPPSPTSPAPTLGPTRYS
jgi:hypothetical protein